MSRDNKETLRRFYEAGFDSEEILRFLDPEVELYPGIETPDQHQRYVGREGWSEFVEGAIEVWESVAIEHKEMLETADDRILGIDRWLFTGRDGIEIERELPTLFTFRDGLIVRIDGFTDKTDALEAAGLRE